MFLKNKVLKTACILLLSTHYLNAQSLHSFHISGEVSTNEKIYFFIQTPKHPSPINIDSVVVSQGKFNYTGNTKEITFYQLRYENREGKTITGGFFTEPGHIVLKENKDKKMLVVSGTPANDQYQSLENSLGDYYQHAYPLTDSINEYSYQGSLARDAGKSGDDLIVYQNKIKDFYKELDPWEIKRRAIAIAFMYNHPQSYVTAKIASYFNGDISKDSIMTIYNNLGDKVQNSELGKTLHNAVVGEKVAEVGATAIPFTATDINRKKITLSDYKGKYVLLDFWASWCIPCRAGNPHMIEQYNKYKTKGFEIIGISDDDRNPDKWKAAVAKDKINIWKHVLRGASDKNALSGKGDLSVMYNVHSYPTKILLDKEGFIIGRYQDDAELDKKLEEIFAKQLQ